MNPSVSFPLSVLFLLLLILFLSSSFASHADDQDEDPFKSCEPFDCGKELKEISYPFRGKYQPEYCGYPGFVLDCESDPDSPMLDVVSQKFRVLDINQKDRVLKIARMDFWDSYCPENFINTTLNSTPFQYTPKDKNTTLFCDCNNTLSNLFDYDCPGKNVSRWAYFVPDEPYLGSPDFTWLECGMSVVVPIMEEVVKGQVKSFDEVRKVFQRGFEVEWKIKGEDRCSECLNYRGRCGYNSSATDQDNQFMCFCPPDPQSDELTCGPPHKPVPESHVYPAEGPDPENSRKDVNFRDCDLPFECGGVKNLSFPFWGDGRPQSCGHPGFELRCERGEYPVMDIDKVEYRVLNVSQENSTMALARSDLWDSPCSPRHVNTTFTPPRFFNYTQGVVNLTLFYHCPKVDLFPYNFSCPGQDVRDNSYYHKGDFVNDNSPLLNEFGACGSSVQVPVFEAALDEIPDQNGLEDVRRALREGFGLNYTEFPLCRACEISGGRCGTSDHEETFCCYCRDGTEEFACPLDTAEDVNFRECDHPYECGNVKNLSFPFWGDGRPQSCGHPGFELRCERGEYPVIDIDEVEYRVLNVSQENSTMILARSDLWDSPCSPGPVNTTFTPPLLFNYTQGVVNLTLYYHCPKVDLFPYNLSCPGRDDGDNSYYHKGDFVNDNSPFLNELRACGSFVQVPVLEAALDEPPDHDGREDVTRALREGFGLNYPEFPCCRQCEISGGRCGTSDSGETFYCFPRNGTAKLCPLDTAEGRNLKLKIGIGVGCGLGGAIIMCVVLLLCFRMRRKREKNPPRSLLSRDISSDFSSGKDAEKGSTYFGVHLFSYEELVEATNNFDTSKELGDGGFGTVYYGKLHDGRVVAVKRLYENNFRRVEQFKNEIAILARLRHRNLVSLYGCTSRHSHELLLVYEYIPNGTVADHLHGEKAKPGALPWAIRLNIAVETASALTYLHASDIIHRDVKTNNILLDNDFSVKVADFGLSRLFPTHVTHISTAPQGTPGYVDPEYHQCYQLTSKSDVFSFGVVMMELVSSMPAVDITRHRHDINLSTMAMNRIQNHALHEIVDPTLGFDTDSRVRKMITAVAELAFQCLQHEKDLRPSMVDVLEELKAIQSREYSIERAEKIDAAADDAVLLMSGPHPLSPDSVVSKWESSTTTPNASS